MYPLIVTDDTQIPHRLDTADTVKEALTGELLTFATIGGSITALEPYDAEADCEIDGASFVGGTPGLFRLRATATHGVRQLLIRVVDPSVLAAIPDYGLRVGAGHSAAPRLVLRSVCNHGPAAWDGTADWFWDNRIKLADYGCVASQL